MKARKAKRARLTVPSSAIPSTSVGTDLPSLSAVRAVSSISMEPTGHTDHDVLTSPPVLATVESSILATSDLHSFVPDRVGSFKCNDWQSWPVSRFCKELKEAVPNVTEFRADDI